MIQLLIPLELEDRLLQEAERRGQTAEALALSLIEQNVPQLDPTVPSPLEKRRAAALEMLAKWSEESSNAGEDDEDDLEDFLRALDANRNIELLSSFVHVEHWQNIKP